MTLMPKRIIPLERPDQWHLNAAEGWLGLGDAVSAHEELDNITPEMRAHPAVLLARCNIYHAAAKWESVVEVAGTLVQQFPEMDQPWILRSFALHELKRTQEAHDLLRPVVEQFPKLWVVPYNLACYCAQLGDLKQAYQWLEMAFERGDENHIKLQALEDPDLEFLWADISEI